MINTLEDLISIAKQANKTPKLVEILLDENGDKEFAILKIAKEERKVTTNTVIDYIQNVANITNSLLVENQLYIIPSATNFKDLSNSVYTDWTVLEYLGRSKWLCECSCGVRRAVVGMSLSNGKSTSCGHDTNAFIDLKDTVIGDWTVKKYNGQGFWLCDCKCGNKDILVKSQSLVYGKSRSCGHTTTQFKDLAGQKINKWTVIDYCGPGTRKWNCTCECSPTVIHQIDTQSLLDGRSKSCGQCSHEPRKIWQENAIKTKETFNSILLNATLSLNRQLYLQDIEFIFDISSSHARALIKKYDATCYLTPSDIGISYDEQQIVNIIQDFDKNIRIIQRDRTVLHGHELDVYLPDYSVAIEYNGAYWHNSEHKSINYHKYKTLQCLKQGVTLIHIFEHEWKNSEIQQKIIELLKQKLNIEQKEINSYLTQIKQINIEAAQQFIKANSLQESTNIDKAYGQYYNDVLIAVMTFNHESSTLENYCVKFGYKLSDSGYKMLQHIIKDNNVTIIDTMIDLTKDNGQEFIRLGFKLIGYTNPEFTYIKSNTFDIVEDTESSENILFSENYFKLYDCGKAHYRKEIFV